MSVTAILGGPAKETAVQLAYAISLTQKLQTTLTSLSVMPDPATAFIYSSSPEAIMVTSSGLEAVEEAQTEALAAYRAAFDKAKEEAGDWLNADFVHETGLIQDYAASAALLSDAVVFPRDSASSGHSLNPAFEHVLMEARLPLVMASDTGRADGPCIIAWDGSSQAARAVRLHLPLIAAAGHAVIVQHPGKLRRSAHQTKSGDPNALAKWLQEQRVETEIALIEGRVSEGVLSIARDRKAGLLVMGAYGHNRIGEMLFGGTSREILNEPGSPALAIVH